MVEIHITKSWYSLCNWLMVQSHGIDSWYTLMELTHYHTSHINTCQYLEDVKWLTMCNPLHATSIDGQNAVTLLDSSIPVRRAASKYLVNLIWTQIILKSRKFQQLHLQVIYYHDSDQPCVQSGYISAMLTVPPQSLLLHVSSSLYQFLL